MGLDIFHKKVCHDDPEGHYDIDDDDSGENPLKKFAALAIEKTNTYIDWAQTFARRSLNADHYTMGMMSSSGDGTEYVFYRSTEAPPDLPERVSFSDNPGCEDLVTFQKVDRVVPCVEAGYQRKSVRQAFYQEFAPWETITDRARVERIHALTLPDSQPAFKAQFLDNWEDDKSFVVVWY